MINYDVLIVGAGPVGTTFARYMALNGFKVGVLEKKKEVGVPLQCAGLLGKQIKKVNPLPNELIINQVYGAYIHSPSNHELKISKKEPQAYVLDRVGYDKFLAQLAVDAGAELFLNHRVKDVDIKKGQVYMGNGKEEMSAKVIIGADGYNSLISEKIFNESNKTQKQVQAAQFLVNFKKKLFDTNYVHLHLNAALSPGFIWTIPLTESTARIGLFGNKDYHQLNNILKDFLNHNTKYGEYSILKKYYGIIPVYNSKKKLVKNNSLLLGDAAAQVKPTTGGGLIMGFKCAKIAADITTKALKNDDMRILTDYESEYQNKFKKELNMQLRVQNIFKTLSDNDLDYMLNKLKDKGAEKIISEYGDIDSQSPLIKELLKTDLLFTILPKILSRRISSLWK
ncbi:MAG: geranylgeranyl reductase family protein [Methanobacterium sp.]